MLYLFKRPYQCFLACAIVSFFITSTITLYSEKYFLQEKDTDLSVSTENATNTAKTKQSETASNPNLAPRTQWLATWFATFKTSKTRKLIQESVIVNRGKFVSSFMRPILFLNNSNEEISDVARANKWHVTSVPRTNEFNIPFISDMIDVTMGKPYNSVFYGFANDDILFGDSLTVTLKSIAALIHSKKLDKSVLVIGQKSNFVAKINWTEPINEFSLLDRIIPNATLDLATAIDYFFFTRDYPRFLFDGLVIGRPAFDNYVVAESIRRKVTVIDATKTISALHLGSPYPKAEPRWGGRYNSPDMDYNRRKLPRANYTKGSIDNALYETTFNLDCLCVNVRKRRGRIRI